MFYSVSFINIKNLITLHKLLWIWKLEVKLQPKDGECRVCELDLVSKTTSTFIIIHFAILFVTKLCLCLFLPLLTVWTLFCKDVVTLQLNPLSAVWVEAITNMFARGWEG